MNTADRVSSLLRVMSITLLVLSALPMLLLVFGLLAMIGQQCTPHSVTHTVVEQVGAIAVVLAFYATPFAGTILLLRLGRPVWWMRALALCAAGLAVLFSLVAMFVVSLATMC